MSERELPEAPEPLPVPTIDAHTHLASTVERVGLSVAEVLGMAAAAGVTRVVDVGCDVASSAESILFAQTYPQVISCIAIHPNDAARLGPQVDAGLDELEKLIPGARGIGETGLDYYRTRDTGGQALQRHAFARHIAWAKEHALPLVIHDRDAHGDILDVLDAETGPDKVMMHCFSGDADFAKRCLDRGAWLSFPGTVTFKANEALREALDIAPLDRILVETDAPYLTPMPHRGKPNGPYLIPYTVRFMAERRRVDVAELSAQLAANAVALFGEW
ncbi:MAG: TatD family hydrolase [Propionibacteriaceae bacterium]|jgi:TatD DNase family protein|nr:TatD family hydrolase [Propionibacteriaceae bacterium]